MTPQGNLPGTGPGKLYVFLHGLICLVESQDKFLGLVVDMGSAHSYKLGDWLTEVPLPRGSVVTLKNVTAGKAGFDGSKVSILQTSLFPLPHLYATLQLPKPAAIHSLRRTTVPTNVITGSGLGNLSQPKAGFFTLAALQILEYDFPEIGTVTIDPPLWGPPTVFRNSRSSTLHFFAEPEIVKSPTHPIDEFRISSGLFQDFNATINSVLAMSVLETAEYPKDLSTNEALGLFERKSILESVAAFYKGDGSTGLAAPSTGGPGNVLCGNVVMRIS
jgi:hypothetical protein